MIINCVWIWVSVFFVFFATGGAAFGKNMTRENYPILQASYTGDTNAVVKLIDSGVDVNVQESRKGWTALMFACKRGDHGIASMLVEAGAKVNYSEPRGKYTPLMLAVDSGNTNIVQSLLKAGGDPNLKDIYGSSALLRARGHRRLGMESILLHHGAEDMKSVTSVEEITKLDSEACRRELTRLESAHKKWMTKNYKQYISQYRPTWSDIKPYVDKSLPVYGRDGKDLFGNGFLFNAFRSGHYPITLSLESTALFEKIIGGKKASKEFWGSYYPRGSEKK